VKEVNDLEKVGKILIQKDKESNGQSISELLKIKQVQIKLVSEIIQLKKATESGQKKNADETSLSKIQILDLLQELKKTQTELNSEISAFKNAQKQEKAQSQQKLDVLRGENVMNCMSEKESVELEEFRKSHLILTTENDLLKKAAKLQE